MTQCGAQLDLKIFSCFFCLDLLKDPVTTSCGHTYCMKCLQHHWDAEEEEKRVSSCPQCDRTFTVRPVLEKNTMLAALLEKIGLQAAPAELSSPAAEDVTCDVCTAALRERHKLVEPIQELQENICLRHDEVMKMFCHTDQQNICYLCYMDGHQCHDIVTVVALERQRELKATSKKIQKMAQSSTVVLVSGPEPKSREDFLKYSCQITLDPNTANEHLLLSEGNRKMTFTDEAQPYCDHPDRFTEAPQVLSRESLTGRCYWEVEWTGFGVEIAMAYSNFSSNHWLKDCFFGLNEKSWIFSCTLEEYKIGHNQILSLVFAPLYNRVGVYLDYSAGVLCFYGVSETMELLHRVETTFTQPLYAAFALHPCTAVELISM